MLEHVKSRIRRLGPLTAAVLASSMLVAVLPLFMDSAPALPTLLVALGVPSVLVLILRLGELRRSLRRADRRLRLAHGWTLRLLDLELEFEVTGLRITSASSREASALGFTVSELPGRSILEILPGGESDAGLGPLARQEFLSSPGAFQLELRGPDGQPRMAEAVVAPGREAGTRRVGLRDITERHSQLMENEERSLAMEFANQYITELNRELESSGKELEAARARLVELNESKSRFLAVAAHELRTPMTAAKTAVSLLQAGMMGPVSGQQGEVLGIIHQNVDRLVRLVNDLLDLARIEAGKVELRCQDFDVAAVLRQAAELMNSEAARRNIEIRVEASGISWFADADRIQQVVINLLGNAVKFTPEGGRVVLDARETDEGLRVEVRDSGEGITPEELPLLFKPFERLQNEATRKAKGTGLGLSISRELVELHGGRIWPESVVGKGTTVFFTIPAQLDQPAAAA